MGPTASHKCQCRVTGYYPVFLESNQLPKSRENSCSVTKAASSSTGHLNISLRGSSRSTRLTRFSMGMLTCLASSKSPAAELFALGLWIQRAPHCFPLPGPPALLTGQCCSRQVGVGGDAVGTGLQPGTGGLLPDGWGPLCSSGGLNRGTVSVVCALLSPVVLLHSFNPPSNGDFKG